MAVSSITDPPLVDAVAGAISLVRPTSTATAARVQAHTRSRPRAPTQPVDPDSAHGDVGPPGLEVLRWRYRRPGRTTAGRRRPVVGPVQCVRRRPARDPREDREQSRDARVPRDRAAPAARPPRPGSARRPRRRYPTTRRLVAGSPRRARGAGGPGTGTTEGPDSRDVPGPLEIQEPLHRRPDRLPHAPGPPGAEAPHPAQRAGGAATRHHPHRPGPRDVASHTRGHAGG